MARRNDHVWAEAGDDYTPATDLVFSVFAMTVLLLALLGAGGHADRADNAKRTEEDHVTIDILKKKNSELSQALQNNVPSEARRKLAEAQRLVEDYRARLRAFEDQPPFAQIKVGSVTESEVGPFMQDDTRFSPVVGAKLISLISQNAEQIARVGTTRLLFELATSAALGTGDDGTDMDMMETMVWGEALMRWMRPHSIPVGCMAVVPIGKLRSVYMRALTSAPNAGKAIDDFDRLLALKERPPAIAREIEKGRRDDRRITIWAQRSASESCDPAVMASSARALKISR